jgi:hypothetical protein
MKVELRRGNYVGLVSSFTICTLHLSLRWLNQQLGWVRYIARVTETQNVYTILIEIFHGKNTLKWITKKQVVKM